MLPVLITASIAIGAHFDYLKQRGTTVSQPTPRCTWKHKDISDCNVWTQCSGILICFDGVRCLDTKYLSPGASQLPLCSCTGLMASVTTRTERHNLLECQLLPILRSRRQSAFLLVVISNPFSTRYADRVKSAGTYAASLLFRRVRILALCRVQWSALSSACRSLTT